MRSLIIAVAACVLAGCATKSEQTLAPSDVGSDPLGGPPLFDVTREFAEPGAFLGPSPTGVVILKESESARNKAFCSGYLKLDTTDEVGGGSMFARNYIGTRWLLTVSSLSDDEAKNCDYLLSKYDFKRGEALQAALIKAGVDKDNFVGAGPFIAEFMPTGGVIVVNASQYTEPNLKAFAKQWVGLAGQANATTLSDAEDAAAAAPPSCDIVKDAAAGCTIERIALETTAGLIEKRFPEVKVAFAVGQRVACMFLKPKQQEKWCPASA